MNQEIKDDVHHVTTLTQDNDTEEQGKKRTLLSLKNTCDKVHESWNTETM